MSKMYTVLSTFQMGEPWGEGNKNISYWCQLEGLDEFAVKITKQKPLNPGDEVYGSLIAGDDGKPFLSQGGKPFMKFKGEMTPEGSPRPKSAGYAAATAPAQSNSNAPAVHPSDDRDVPLWFAPFGVMIKAIYDEVCRPADTPLTQHDVMTEAAKTDEPFTEPKKETIGDTEITPEELENIFGGPIADPVDLADDK